MALGNWLSGIYNGIENRYYGVLDWLEAKGISLPWTVNDFLEGKGVPALPFLAAILLIILGAGYAFLFFNAPSTVTVQLDLKDNLGNPLQDVKIAAFNSNGESLLNEQEISNSGSIELKGIKLGQDIQISVQKDGYESGEQTFSPNSNSAAIKFELKKQISSLVAGIRMIDSETQTAISNAAVHASWKTASIDIVRQSDDSGGVQLNGIPSNEDISISISASNYEDFQGTFTFLDNETKTISLTPLASATTGKSDLIIRAYQEGSTFLLSDVDIKIVNEVSGEEITAVKDADGEYVQNLSKGSNVHVVVSKSGFVSYTSAPLTLRNPEETIKAELPLGSNDLQVTIASQDSGVVVENSIVQVYDFSHQLVDTKTTSFDGEAHFTGLQADGQYDITAYAQGYLSSRQSIKPLDLEQGKNGRSLQLKLETETFSNSSLLTVFVNNSTQKPESNAIVNFFELLDDGSQLPLGIPSSTTDELGSASVKVKNGIHVLAKAGKGTFEGIGDATISGDKANTISILLTSADSSIQFNIVNDNGLPFVGNAEISTKEGDLLFSGSVVGGKVPVEAFENKTLKIKLTDIVGNTFEQEIAVQGNVSPTITFSSAKTTSTNAPDISFVGIFDSSGNEVKGITPEADYFARIQVKWPEGISSATGGVHVRVGDDAIKFVDSQNIGILGFTGSSQNFFYGRSWAPSPTPGNEALDRQNAGSAGKFSKWLELSASNPKGTQVYDIRIRARKTIQLGEENFFYRAWVNAGFNYSRSPADDALGAKNYTDQKLGLYANANVKKIPIYESLPVCSGDLCTGFKFVQEDGREFSPDKFEAIEGRVYALELEFKHNDVGAITVNASTSKDNPQIEFVGHEVNTFKAFPTAGGNATGEENLSINGNGKARIYFKAMNAENASIDVSASAGTNTLNQTLNFNIVKEKTIHVELKNSYQIGEEISLSVNDETGGGIGNAFVRFLDEKGNEAFSTRGLNAPGKGLNGLYSIKNNLKTGIYDVKVSAQGFSTFEDSVSIGIKGAIELDEIISAKLNAGGTGKTINAKIKNNLNSPLSDLGFELREIGNFPANLQVQVTLPPSINAKAGGQFQINVNYLGDKDSQERLQGEMELVVHGLNAGKTLTSSSARLTVSYNQALDDSCLTFNKKALDITMLDEGSSNNFNPFSQASYYGNSNPSGQYTQPGFQNFNSSSGFNQYGVGGDGSYFSSNGKRTDLVVKNDCGQELSFIPSVINTQAVQGVNVIVDSSFKIKHGEEKTFHVDVQNQFYRQGLTPGNYQYMLSFQNPSITRNIPLNVQLWNRSYALDAPQTLEVFLTKTGKEKAYDKLPINLTNIGMADIYNLQANLGSESLSGVSVKLNPNTPVQFFPRGSPLFPPYFVEVESDAAESKDFTKSISISGIIDGRRLELRKIDLIIHLSSASCLQAIPDEKPLRYQSSELVGAIGKNVVLSNSCAEPVRIASLSPSSFGNNKMELNQQGQNLVINPGSTTSIQILLSKAEAFKGEKSVKISGLLVNSQRFVETEPIQVSIALGDQEVASARASKEVKLNVCEDIKQQVSVKFPIIASGTDCSSGYCDADQLSQYLAEKIDDKIKAAQQEANRKKGDLSKFPGCNNNNYCTFSQIGIPSEDIPIYFQNDNLTKELMETLFAQGDTRFSRFKNDHVDYLTGSNAEDQFMQKISGGNVGGTISIPKFEGCGFYSASIAGAFVVTNGQIQADQVNVLVKLQEIAKDKFRKETGECTQKIQNVQNFLPKDKSLNYNDTRGTYLGVVEATDDAQVLAQTVAKELFENDNRFQNNSQSNRLNLSLSDSLDTLARVEMDPSTSTAATKKINLIVKTIENDDEQKKIDQQNQIVQEASRAMNGLASGSIDCIGQQENYFKISTVGKIGGFKVEGCGFEDNTYDGKLVVRSTEACCELRVKSEISASVKYELTPANADKINGLLSMELKTSEPVPLKSPGYVKAGDSKSATSLVPEWSVNHAPGAPINQGGDYPYKLELNEDASANFYEARAFFCATGNPAQVMPNKKIVITVTRSVPNQASKKIQLLTCQTAPEVALAKAVEKGEGTWSFTSSQDKDLRNSIIDSQNKGLVKDKFFQFTTGDILAASDPVYQEKDKQKKLWAIGGYETACGVACTACYAGLGIFTGGLGAGMIPSCALDCLIPGGIGLYEIYKEDVKKVPVASGIIEGTWGKARDGISALTPGKSEGIQDPMFSAFVAEKTIRTAKGVISVEAIQNISKIRDAASDTLKLGPGTVAGKDEVLQEILGNTSKFIENRSAITQVNQAYARVTLKESELKAATASLDRLSAIGQGQRPPNGIINQITAQQGVVDGLQTQLQTASDDLFRVANANGMTSTRNVENVLESVKNLEAENAALNKTVQSQFADGLKKLKDSTAELKAAIKDTSRFTAAELRDAKALAAQMDTLIPELEQIAKKSAYDQLATKFVGNTFIDKTVAAKTAEAAKAKGLIGKFFESEVKGNFKFARGLICGTAGNYAGYKEFNNIYSKEVEGRVAISAGTLENSGEYKFIEGETYQIKLSKDKGINSFKADITALGSSDTVAPVSWVDDCSDPAASRGSKPSASAPAAPAAPTTPAPASPSPPAAAPKK